MLALQFSTKVKLQFAITKNRWQIKTRKKFFFDDCSQSKKKTYNDEKIQKQSLAILRKTVILTKNAVYWNDKLKPKHLKKIWFLDNYKTSMWKFNMNFFNTIQ